jgi:hypothetical protein
MKSVAIAQAVAVMNLAIWIEPESNTVGKETTQIYNDLFYENLSDFCNALGNIAAHLFSDRQAEPKM